jgi:hypothetical protein
MLVRALDLVLVDGDARELRAGVAGNDSHRAADTAADVKAVHALLQANLLANAALVVLQ